MKTQQISKIGYGKQVITKDLKFYTNLKQAYFIFMVFIKILILKGVPLLSVLWKNYAKRLFHLILKEKFIKKNKIIAILPIRGKAIEYQNKYLMEFTIKNFK